MNKNFCKILFLIFVGVYLIFSASCTKCDCNSCECIVPIEESLAGTSWKWEHEWANGRVMEKFTYFETEAIWETALWEIDEETGEERRDSSLVTGTYTYVKPTVVMKFERENGYIDSGSVTVTDDFLYTNGKFFYKQ